MENQSKLLTMVGAQDGPSVAVVGDTYRIVISGKQTNGAYAVIDMLIPPNGGPGPHAHTTVQEAFYVLDGEIEVKTAEGTYTATKGAFINIPTGGLVHSFKNKTNNLAHMLCIVTPAGMDDFFLEIGQPVTAGVILEPQEAPDEATIEKLKAIAEKYGQKIYPPNYFD
jgi:quercetin dioxygenase-like cupin family protein